MSDSDQKQILEQFFYECLRYWERELNVSSDDSREPFINAIREIPKANPYHIGEIEKFDENIRNEFIKYRLMDCFGRSWETHLGEFENIR